MLTIKWIVNTPHGTIERLFEARSVEIAHRTYGPPGEPGHGRPPVQHWEVSGRAVDSALCILDPTEPHFAGRSFNCGTVYVMNETGSTVAKHVLSDEIVAAPEPLPKAA